MKILFGDTELEADTPATLVSEMQRSSPFEEKKSRARYMEELAGRAMVTSGATIRTTDAKTFLEDLIASGLVKEL